MHRIVTNAACNMVEIRLSCFASIAEVDVLATDFQSLFSLGKVKPEYLLLIDVSACPVQSQSVLMAVAQVASRVPKAKRIAVISQSAMLNMQLLRALNRPYLRAVTERSAALDWLISQREPKQAA